MHCHPNKDLLRSILIFCPDACQLDRVITRVIACSLIPAQVLMSELAAVKHRAGFCSCQPRPR